MMYRSTMKVSGQSEYTWPRKGGKTQVLGGDFCIFGMTFPSHTVLQCTGQDTGRTENALCYLLVSVLVSWTCIGRLENSPRLARLLLPQIDRYALTALGTIRIFGDDHSTAMCKDCFDQIFTSIELVLGDFKIHLYSHASIFPNLTAVHFTALGTIGIFW